MNKIGARVGAIREADNDTVYLFGYGTYEGEEVPPDGWLHDAGVPNPKIKLDNGKIVWGYECWWGSEEKIEEMIDNRKVIEV